MAEKNDYIISAAVRCLRVLQLFDSQHREMTQTEIAMRAGLTKSSCLRVLVTLESEGFVEYIEKTKCYRLGSTILRLTYNGYTFSNLRDLLKDDLQALASEFSVLTQLGVIEGDGVVIISREYPNSAAEHLTLVAPMGREIPLHCTGLGKVLMAYASPHVRENCMKKCRFERYQENTITDRAQYDQVLRQIRADGYCITDREHEEDVICMTLPIFDHRGDVVAAISSTGRVDRMNPGIHQAMRSRMAEIAMAASRKLGRE